MTYRSLLATVLRFGAYSAVLLVFLATLPMLSQPGDISLFKEGGLIEWVQFGLLLIMALGFTAGCIALKRHRASLILLAMVSWLGVIREQDSLLDDLIPIGGWQLPAIIVILVCLTIAFRNRNKLLPELQLLLTSRAFGVLWAGLMIVTIFAQLVGHGDFLRMIMGDDYDRQYKRIIEEMTELLGYFVIFIGSIETICVLKHCGEDLWAWEGSTTTEGAKSGNLRHGHVRGKVPSRSLVRKLGGR